MSNQLTESEVARVVAEVTRQAQLRNLEERQVLDREQVVQILEELRLPAELLDPAMQELERRDAEAAVQARQDEVLRASRRRKYWIIASTLAVVLIVILISVTFVHRRNEAFSAIAAVEPGRITYSSDDGGSLGTVSRDGKELYYRVTLERVPISESLSLQCNWIDPVGRIAKTSSWQTKTTDKSIWATSCRNTIGTATAAGEWRVEMLLDGRVISQTDFRVE
jgi:hypothetical protein